MNGVTHATELTEPTELAMQGLICRFCQFCHRSSASVPAPRPCPTHATEATKETDGSDSVAGPPESTLAPRRPGASDQSDASDEKVAAVVLATCAGNARLPRLLAGRLRSPDFYTGGDSGTNIGSGPTNGVRSTRRISRPPA